MQQQPSGGHCVAAIGAVTNAMAAQKALFDNGIYAEVTALSPRETKRGCAYGISYPCEREKELRQILRGKHIPVSEFLRKPRGLL